MQIIDLITTILGFAATTILMTSGRPELHLAAIFAATSTFAHFRLWASSLKQD